MIAGKVTCRRVTSEIQEATLRDRAMALSVEEMCQRIEVRK